MFQFHAEDGDVGSSGLARLMYSFPIKNYPRGLCALYIRGKVIHGPLYRWPSST